MIGERCAGALSDLSSIHLPTYLPLLPNHSLDSMAAAATLDSLRRFQNTKVSKLERCGLEVSGRWQQC